MQSIFLFLHLHMCYRKLYTNHSVILKIAVFITSFPTNGLQRKKIPWFSK